MKNRIIAISNHGFMIGGGEHSYFDLLSNLPKKYHIISTVPQNGELAYKLKAKNINNVVIPMPAIRPWLIIKNLICIQSYLRVCKMNHPQLIYANGSRAAIYGGIIGKILNIPVIWHCRIANSDLFVDTLLTKLCKKIIVNSNATACRFKSTFSHKLKVIYNGIDIGWFEKDKNIKNTLIDSDWKIILMVARISKWKRHDLALSCFEKIAHFNEKIHIFFIGDNDKNEPNWLKYLYETTKRSPYYDRIHWIGHENDMRSWYRAADILLLPSENEPFGRVLVEAMTCGVPIVATKGGGVPEIVRHGKDGFLVKHGQIQEMVDAVKILLKDDVTRLKMGRSAKERAKDFSLNSHIKAMVEVFEETIEV